RRLIVNMGDCGRVQCLGKVQGMPKAVEARINEMMKKFFWGSRFVKYCQRSSPKGRGGGGGKLLDLAARNQALELIKLQTYLKMGLDRPCWSHLADEIFRRNISKKRGHISYKDAINMFMQSWPVRMKEEYTTVPKSLQGMVNVAKRSNLCLDTLEIDNHARGNLPI
ncbi:hypothetical protein BU17DRAFT_58430, partial [Hysterangium stoloniferum]